MLVLKIAIIIAAIATAFGHGPKANYISAEELRKLLN